MDFWKDLGNGQAVIQVQGHECWLASSSQSCIPGSYATEEAAIYAFQLPDAELARLQDEVNAREEDPEKRVITLGMLKGL